MDPVERRKQGAHYTTEKNILKVIEPLFLDDLRAEFERLKRRTDNRRRADLRRFQRRLGNLTLFDPACGCGNFLIIAYRELRELEIQVLVVSIEILSPVLNQVLPAPDRPDQLAPQATPVLDLLPTTSEEP